ncbi:hypothetical protein F511_23929 [Dorcoceras hygrometricum]|uniref:Uncharacterized protein n=1 Tax=Dorcoceras hygrometricum TaxID=472368 RepID=A0A2Z7BEK4_9LAMI|nr:hypothetical protein F511_23929 [Dorcoceras hygrometricum]
MVAGIDGNLPEKLTVNTAAAAAARRRRKFVSGQLDKENPFVQNSSVLLVQADEGVSVLVVDRIGDIYRSLPRRADVIVTTVGARHKCQQGSGFEPPMYVDNCYQFFVLIVSRLLFYVLPLPRRGTDPDPQQVRYYRSPLLKKTTTIQQGTTTEVQGSLIQGWEQDFKVKTKSYLQLRNARKRTAALSFQSSQLKLPKWVRDERAFQEESNATSNVKNGGRNRRESTGEAHGE